MINYVPVRKDEVLLEFWFRRENYIPQIILKGKTSLIIVAKKKNWWDNKELPRNAALAAGILALLALKGYMTSPGMRLIFMNLLYKALL